MNEVPRIQTVANTSLGVPEQPMGRPLFAPTHGKRGNTEGVTPTSPQSADQVTARAAVSKSRDSSEDATLAAHLWATGNDGGRPAIEHNHNPDSTAGPENSFENYISPWSETKVADLYAMLLDDAYEDPVDFPVEGDDWIGLKLGRPSFRRMPPPEPPPEPFDA